jgi:hypothetical protein
MNTKKFLYAPALFTALALIVTSECLASSGVGQLGDLTLPVPPVLAVVYSIRGHRGNDFTTKPAKSLQLVLIT